MKKYLKKYFLTLLFSLQKSVGVLISLIVKTLALLSVENHQL